MIVKGQQLQVARTAVTRAELREHLIELWAQVFERELREERDADVDGDAAAQQEVTAGDRGHSR